MGSAKGSPHPPNTPSLQYTTAAHAFVLSVRLCREHGFPYPTILLYTSLLIPPPLLLLYYFPTKCSSFVPAPLLLSSHTMQRAEHSAQVSPVFSLIVKRCWLTLFQGLGETDGSESVKVIRIYCRTMDLKQCNFQKVMVKNITKGTKDPDNACDNQIKSFTFLRPPAYPCDFRQGWTDAS